MAQQDDIRQNVAVLQDTLLRLERRLADVERSLGVGLGGEARETPSRMKTANEAPSRSTDADDLALEVQIGELWVGHAGVVALLIGVAFFIIYPLGFHPAVQSLAGFLAVGGLFVFAQRWQAAYPSISRTIFTGSLILLYFTTLRLHFFNADPLVGNKVLGLIVIVAAVGFVFYVSAVRRSQPLAFLAIFLGVVTGLCSDTAHFALFAFAATSAAAVFFRLRYGWDSGVLFCLFMVYGAHLLWLFNNPILGHPVRAVSEHHGNLVYLFVYATLFGISNLPERKTSDSGLGNIALTLVNGAGFYLIGVLVAQTFFKAHFAGINLLLSAFFLVLASVYWIYRESRFSTAFYACFGYVALSVALVTYFDNPARFLWLGWQSLLVICTAIWFRSRIVVVSNVLIYVLILLYYLLLIPSDLWVNLSYAIVALLSARVMNWQKERLTLKTESMRNLYLTSAFVMLPYALYHGVPEHYVSASWLGVALFYFALSLLLKNRKYRWMAILTLFLTVVYVFLMDLARLNPVYRILSFLIVGVTMLAVSWMYARYRQKTIDN